MTTESEIEDTASSATVTIPAVAKKKTDYYENISGFGVADWFHGMFCNGPWMSDRNFNLVMPKEFNNYHPLYVIVVNVVHFRILICFDVHHVRL